MHNNTLRTFPSGRRRSGWTIYRPLHQAFSNAQAQALLQPYVQTKFQTRWRKTYLADPTFVLPSAVIDVILRTARVTNDQVIRRREFRSRHLGRLIVFSSVEEYNVSFVFDIGSQRNARIKWLSSHMRHHVGVGEMPGCEI